MPETWVPNVMAMCCGLSLAVALGWNVTAGAAEWRHLAQSLCIVSPGDTIADADRACQFAVDQSRDLALRSP